MVFLGEFCWRISVRAVHSRGEAIHLPPKTIVQAVAERLQGTRAVSRIGSKSRITGWQKTGRRFAR